MFMLGMTKLWLLDGTRRSGELAAHRAKLANRGIDFLEGDVNAIDLENRVVRVGNRRLQYDYLIVALGADYAPNATPGFTRYAKNLYTESGCAEIRDELRSLNASTVTVLVCGLPVKCPPAPYEAAMIIDDVLRKSDVRDKVKLQVVTPEPHPLPILGPDAGKEIVKLLQERRIEYFSSHKVKEILRDRTTSEDGKEVVHDLVVAVPIHVAPAVLKLSGLTDQSGWVPVNPTTLATNIPGVYAIGDCAGTKTPKGALLPRAGILAEEQGKVVASNLIQEIQGNPERTDFEGRGVCYMEVGDRKAAKVSAHFYAQPGPRWEFSAPTAEGYDEKRRFVEERLSFGAPT